jgi:hypothetical protein
MKVKDLIEEIERCKKYYSDILEWEVYTEQISNSQKRTGDIDRIKDSEDFEYYESLGFWTKFPKEKIFTININY